MYFDHNAESVMNRTATGGAAIAAAGSVLAATFLTGCHCGTPEMPRTTSGVVLATAHAPNGMDGQYDQFAVQTLDSIVHGDYETATAHFDTEMQQKLTPPVIEAVWAAYQNHLGTYQSHLDPQHVAAGDFTVVNIPLQMQRSPGDLWVTFNTDGTVAGLFLLKPRLPAS